MLLWWSVPTAKQASLLPIAWDAAVRLGSAVAISRLYGHQLWVCAPRDSLLVACLGWWATSHRPPLGRVQPCTMTNAPQLQPSQSWLAAGTVGWARVVAVSTRLDHQLIPWTARFARCSALRGSMQCRIKFYIPCPKKYTVPRGCDNTRMEQHHEGATRVLLLRCALCLNRSVFRSWIRIRMLVWLSHCRCHCERGESGLSKDTTHPG